VIYEEKIKRNSDSIYVIRKHYIKLKKYIELYIYYPPPKEEGLGVGESLLKGFVKRVG
jgi:hypothetical protein